MRAPLPAVLSGLADRHNGAVTTTGLLLAAGAGRRMGRPKALVRDWLARSVEALADCDDVVVVLGAEAERARPRLDGTPATVLVAADWAEGMGASLRAGLRHLEQGDATRCLVTLVDLPDVGAGVARRMLGCADTTSVLARATYAGRPGHPVLLGRTHWAGVVDTATGDRGARDYLATHDVEPVECGDLATGLDVDEE